MTDEKKSSTSSTPKAKAADAADQGYIGNTTDPTPRENYTVAGVISGKPTPESDERLAKAAADARRGS